ncbi:protein kinase family protein [Nocardia sp. NPDC059091]|uniref:protein kinase family protein n=1 Tax=unclassified Nocardia TaxID=2637762 RepID=UPI003688C671
MHDADSLYSARLSRYAMTRSHLSGMPDRTLEQIMAAGMLDRSGIGGRSTVVDLDGTQVFAKRVPLTELELRPEHARSTANIFGLPAFYQYGLGSTGFGAWRELMAHIITTGWVLEHDYVGFPLMYHWRVLPDIAPRDFADEFGGLEGAVAHWDGSLAVHRRLTAISKSTFSLVLFLEYVPCTLADWLTGHRSEAGTYQWAAEALAQGTAFLSNHGFTHFDAHFANLLTDGRLIYFADLGLALSSQFDLSPAEAEFLTRHRLYDKCYTANHMLAHYLLGDVCDKSEYEALLCNWIAGRRPDNISPELIPIIDRHARPALILNGFHRDLLARSKRALFPHARIDLAYKGNRLAEY